MSFHPALITGSGHCVPVYLFTQDVDWTRHDCLDPGLQALAQAHRFRGYAGETVLSANEAGQPTGVLFGLGDGRDALALAALPARLPAGDYKIAHACGYRPDHIAAGWADGVYQFDRYVPRKTGPARLVVGSSHVGRVMIREAIAISRLRDLVNTPAEDMGPKDLQATIADLAKCHGGYLQEFAGPALQTENYPMVFAVGRAGSREPRFIELSWGDENAPEVALIGKGVVFDTGGLNIKTGQHMRLMKKDMGGAAHAIALAELIMASNLPVHLKLYVPAVENSLSGSAFRPGDVLASRKGLYVETDNTDAEGRLVLADALTRACEGTPDLVIDFATLTGAARIALGPDLAPYYTDDDSLATAIDKAGAESGDPVWRMPLWTPYESMLKSSIADLVNSTPSPFAGSVIAALFLRRFVNTKRWIHFDIWSWRESRYGRPSGAAACGLRAAWTMLQDRYGK